MASLVLPCRRSRHRARTGLGAESTTCADGDGYTRRATEEDGLQGIELANDVVDALADRQAADVVLLDVQEYAGFADYFVIATSGSDRQMRALVEAVDAAADGHERHPRWEGRHEDGWMLADLGDVIVHLLTMEERARYDIEGLWQRAQEVVHIQ